MWSWFRRRTRADDNDEFARWLLRTVKELRDERPIRGKPRGPFGIEKQ